MLRLNKILQGTAIGLVAFGLATGLHVSRSLEPIENLAWDWRVRRLAAPGSHTDSIRLVLLDQASLEWGRRTMGLPWPWPREIYTAIIEFCRRGGAKAIAFDVVFTEPSYMGVSDDELLGSTIADTPTFVGTAFVGQHTGDIDRWPQSYRYQGLQVEGLKSFLSTVRGTHMLGHTASLSVEEIATNCATIGNVAIQADAEATVRRVPLLIGFDGRAIPSLGLAACLVAAPNEKISIENRRLHVGERSVPLDATGRMILSYRGPSQTHQAVSAQSVIQSELRIKEGEAPVLDPGFFRDAYVFFGYTATALLDLKPTPISSVYPGVEVHATVLDNLLSGDALCDTPQWMTILAVLAAALGIGVLGRFCSNGWQTALLAAVALGLPPVAAFGAYAGGYWLPLVVVELSGVLALGGAIVVNYVTEGRQKRFIKNAFKQYLSPHVIDDLVKNPNALKLGGETRELSIFFSDVQGFTSISEGLGPQELTSLLNDYLTAMTDIILEEGGTVDKYEGDAIIAFWNAPLTLPDHAQRCVRAAIRCQEELDRLRPVFRERIQRDVVARIGINTGQVVVGNMGSNQRFDYTFLGDAGNLASRLEGVNKQFGTYLLVSEMTYKKMENAFFAREVSRVQVVGRNEPVRIYEPMSRDRHERRSDDIETFTRGLEAYYGGEFENAREVFSGVAERDPAAAAYVRRCATLLSDPPANWDGVWRMSEK